MHVPVILVFVWNFCSNGRADVSQCLGRYLTAWEKKEIRGQCFVICRTIQPTICRDALCVATTHTHVRHPGEIRSSNPRVGVVRSIADGNWTFIPKLLKHSSGQSSHEGAVLWMARITSVSTGSPAYEFRPEAHSSHCLSLSSVPFFVGVQQRMRCLPASAKRDTVATRNIDVADIIAKTTATIKGLRRRFCLLWRGL